MEFVTSRNSGWRGLLVEYHARRLLHHAEGFDRVVGVREHAATRLGRHEGQPEAGAQVADGRRCVRIVNLSAAVWALLSGVPNLVVIRATCAQVDDLKPICEFRDARTLLHVELAPCFCVRYRTDRASCRALF